MSERFKLSLNRCVRSPAVALSGSAVTGNSVVWSAGGTCNILRQNANVKNDISLSLSILFAETNLSHNYRFNLHICSKLALYMAYLFAFEYMAILIHLRLWCRAAFFMIIALPYGI
jgi:hypothetical protein